MRPLPVGSLVVLALFTGCDSAHSVLDGYQVADSAGIQIIESTVPVWNSNDVRIEADPLVRIGREEAGPYQFAFVASGALLRDGRIVVSDVGAQEIRAFDSSGIHLSTYGGPGEGPGEFRGLGSVFEGTVDSIAAFDGRLRRTTVVSLATGGHRTIQNQIEGNYEVFGLVPDGPFLLFSPGGAFQPDLAPGLQWVTTKIVSMDRDSGSSRVIGELADRWRNVATDGNAPMPQPLMYAIQAATESGFYWGTPDRYEIRKYDLEGRVRRIIRRPVEAKPVEPSMIEQLMEIELDRVRQFQGDDAVAAARARFESQEFGDLTPLFMTAFVDDEKRLWVGSSEWPLGRFATDWSIFSPEGRWLGEIQAPEGLRILDVSGDAVLGVWHDQLDVPYVQVHRLVGAARRN